MAKVEKSDSWAVRGSLTEIEQAVREVATDAGMNVTGTQRGLLELKGGKLLKARLMGTGMTKAKGLPKTGRVQLDEVAGGVRVRLELKENIGVGLVDSHTKKKYERAFDNITFALHSKLKEKFGPAPDAPAAAAPAPDSVAEEIERLQQLRATGALSEEEFSAAKAKLLGL